MAVIPGSVRFTGFSAPTDSTDTYPVTDAIWGKDGWRSVANTTERDAITTERRKQGMGVWVVSESKLYVLETGITNSDWVEFSPGSGGNLSGTLTSGKIPVATGTNTLGDSALTQSSGNVSCSGQLTGSNLSGTNTGDQDLTNLPTTNQKAAMTNANSPQASNPFLTAADGTNNSTAINQTIGQLPGIENRFYFDSSIIRGSSLQNDIELKALTETPSGLSELTLSCYATSTNSPLFLGAFLASTENNYFGIYAGVTVGKIWTAASDLTGTTEILQNVMRRTPCEGTVTMTGSGTSRTVTASSPIFFAGDGNADKTLATYLYTPVGLYQITACTPPFTATIEVPTAYVNETSVAVTRIVYVYSLTSGNILTTTIQEKTYFSNSNPEYSPNNSVNWAPTDQVVIFLWGKTTVVSFNKIDILINGQSRYSHLEIPGLIPIKSSFEYATISVSTYDNRVGNAYATAGDYNFYVPDDAKQIIGAYLVFFSPASGGATGSGKNIDLTTYYTVTGNGSTQEYTASDTATTYTITGPDTINNISFLSLIANAKYGTNGTLHVASSAGIGGAIVVLGLKIFYI